MKVYLAGPINGCTDEQANDWRTRAKALFPDHLDPMARDYRGRELEPGIAAKIVEQDKLDIHQCGAVVVWFERPSVGTAMEIHHAWTKGIPVIVVDASGKPLSPWLTYHATHVVSSLEEAAKKIDEYETSIRSMLL